ncbi:MAG: hypothetical protein JWO51_1732 [Rhodospirillales bacterium]|nr:hypothetical protein [Rhodospirillales bacterium]
MPGVGFLRTGFEGARGGLARAVRFNAHVSQCDPVSFAVWTLGSPSVINRIDTKGHSLLVEENIVKVILIAALGATLLSGCVRTSEMPLSANTIQIDGSGTKFDSIADVNAKITKTAAEATLAHGFKRFLVVNGASGTTISFIQTPGSYTSQTSGMVLGTGNMATVSATTTGTYSPPMVKPVSKPRGTYIVRLLNPGDPGFDQGIDAAAFLAANG